MQEVVLLGFAHVLIITAVVTGSFVGAILSLKFHVMLILCQMDTVFDFPIDHWEIILIDKGRNKQETRKKSFFGNISLTHLYRMVSMSEQWTLNGFNKMKQSFWINFELGQFNSVSHFCLIAGVEPLDCGYRVVGSLLLLLAISEIIPGLAGTLGDCRMSQFIHYV